MSASVVAVSAPLATMPVTSKKASRIETVLVVLAFSVLAVIIIGVIAYAAYMAITTNSKKKSDEPPKSSGTLSNTIPAANTDTIPSANTNTNTGTSLTSTTAIDNVRYVRVQRVELSTGKEYSINIREIAVYYKGSPIPFTSGVIEPPFEPEKYGWQRLSDGSATTFAHSHGDPAARITLDLGSSKTVDEIVIVNRTDCCSDRIVGCELQLLDSSVKVLKRWAFKDVSDPTSALKGAPRYRVGASTGMVITSSI